MQGCGRQTTFMDRKKNEKRDLGFCLGLKKLDLGLTLFNSINSDY